MNVISQIICEDNQTTTNTISIVDECRGGEKNKGEMVQVWYNEQLRFGSQKRKEYKQSLKFL